MTKSGTARRPRSRAAGLALAAAALLMLTACNPLKQELKLDANGDTTAAIFKYTGPSDAWLELNLTGIAGRSVFMGAVVKGDTSPRECTSASNWNTVVSCTIQGTNMSTPIRFTYSERGVWRPWMKVRSGDVVEVFAYCNGDACLPATIEARTLTALGGGSLVGDLSDMRFN